MDKSLLREPGGKKQIRNLLRERGWSKKRLVERVKEHWRLCSIVTLTILALLIVAGCFIRSFQRGVQMEPLLQALARNTSTCRRGEECTVELSHEDANKFDLHPAENLLFGFLFRQVADNTELHMREILSGANIAFPDPEHNFYNFLSNLDGAQKRISSHRSDSDQYGIPEGRVVHTLLVGTTGRKTWLQLEGASWAPFSAPISETIGHSLDTIQYFFTQRQVGPLGTSRHTDNNPLTFQTPRLAHQACPKFCSTPSRTDIV